MPFNDDVQEKAQRLKSRHALYSIQKNQFKLAVSPVRKISKFDVGKSSPPSSTSAIPFTPIKRVPILANFEEWIRLATDNKINATNSWNVALIDYFHDMSLLKEGDGVNFQRASFTLDGCVKIYTNRVDSIATATGKLLSGLADSRDMKGDGNDYAVSKEDGVGRRRLDKRVRFYFLSQPASIRKSLTLLAYCFAYDIWVIGLNAK